MRVVQFRREQRHLTVFEFVPNLLVSASPRSPVTSKPLEERFVGSEGPELDTQPVAKLFGVNPVQRDAYASIQIDGVGLLPEIPARCRVSMASIAISAAAAESTPPDMDSTQSGCSDAFPGACFR